MVAHQLPQGNWEPCGHDGRRPLLDFPLTTGWAVVNIVGSWKGTPMSENLPPSRLSLDLLQVIEARLSEAVGTASPSTLVALRELSYAFVEAGGAAGRIRLEALEQLAVIADEARKLPTLRRPSVIASAVAVLRRLAAGDPSVAPAWSTVEPVLLAIA